MNQLLVKNVTIKEWLLLAVIPWITIIISFPLFIQTQAITVIMACLLYLSRTPNFRMELSIFQISLVYMSLFGFLIGAYYVVLGENNPFKWIQYTYLSLGAYIAYKTGYSYARRNILYYSIFVFFLETVLYLAILPFLLAGSRTSAGASNLWPVMLLFVISPFYIQSKKTKRLVWGLLIIQVLGLLLSGMRSSLSLSVLSFVLLLLYFLIKGQIRNIRSLVKKILAVVFVIVIGLTVIPSSITNAVNDKVQTVIYRLETTIFNEEGVQVDGNDDQGRVAEGKSMLKETNKRSNDNLQLFGYGHGFQFYDEAVGKISAHAHITYIAYYARYGIVGCILYVLMFAYVIYKVIRLLFGVKRPTANETLLFALWLSVLQIFLISLIAASLISFVNWIIIGLAVSYDFYLRKNKHADLKPM